MYLIRPTSPDLVIPMPTGGDLPATGIVVPVPDLYWQRRAAEADVSIDEVEAETVEAAIAEIGEKVKVDGKAKAKTETVKKD